MVLWGFVYDFVFFNKFSEDVEGIFIKFIDDMSSGGRVRVRDDI